MGGDIRQFVERPVPALVATCDGRGECDTWRRDEDFDVRHVDGKPTCAHRQVLRDLPQRSREDGQPLAPGPGPGEGCRSRGTLGEGDPKDAGGCDAATGLAQTLTD